MDGLKLKRNSRWSSWWCQIYASTLGSASKLTLKFSPPKVLVAISCCCEKTITDCFWDRETGMNCEWLFNPRLAISIRSTIISKTTLPVNHCSTSANQIGPKKRGKHARGPLLPSWSGYLTIVNNIPVKLLGPRGQSYFTWQNSTGPKSYDWTSGTRNLYGTNRKSLYAVGSSVSFSAPRLCTIEGNYLSPDWSEREPVDLCRNYDGQSKPGR